MKVNILYHGSGHAGIKIFEPKEHVVGDSKKIVFATDDRNYAMAMACGTGDDLAVSYATNPETGKRELYIDELKPHALNLLDKEGYVYEVESKYFSSSPEGLDGEYVSTDSVPVISESRVSNILHELKSHKVNVISYDEVPSSMQKRGEVISEPDMRHSPNRFA